MNVSITSFESKTGLESVLKTLGFALPPSSLIHVGIGDAMGASSVWMDWGIQNVLVVEADASRLKKARDVLVTKGYGVNYTGAMVAMVALVGAGDSAKDGTKTDDVSFFKASHPRESGLINPEALRGYWPSLSLSSTAAMKAVSVDGVWQSFLQNKKAQVESDQVDADGKLDGLNWLVVDCLAGIVILDGASEVLKDTAVVCVRALRDVAKESSKQPPALVLESGVEQLDVHLGRLGFRRAAFVTDSHPDVGYGVYCRDGEALAEKKSGPLKEMIGLQEKDLAQVKNEREGLNKQLQEMTVSLDQAKQSKEQAVAEINGQLKTATSDKDALAQQKSVLEADAAALKKKLSELTNKLGDAEQRVETVLQERVSLDKQSEDLTQQKDEAVKRLGDIDAKLATVVKEKETVVAHVDVLVQEKVAIAAQLEEHKKVVAERQTKIDELSKSVQVETQKVKDLTAKVEGVTADKAGLVQQRDAAVHKLVDVDAKLAAVIQEKSVALMQFEALAGQIETLKAEVGSLKQSVETAQKEKESIKQTTQKEHEALVQSLNSKHQEAVTKLQQQTDAVQKELESAKKSVTQLQQQVKDLESVRTESNKLKAENDELHQRQLLMNEELVKAEGQITLIKDLLLREQGI